ncbi:nickel/cobalt efflux protein RcnA [Erwinia psidii]|uniref:Nickel/cobalt efflux system n=1 Tax=Erwinia psidii TaxID=69224 RepID=A0A3N6S1V1_9GAMM|nr:nickel/cobalt efflux protein RcnA [Erwinia psidii]MCX8957650.1 nickel/cobalt efflux protein RcnA [Erwinia psidii]MCX8960704.1 nickel/cobalt efflux protein RcnA [Erwinia psidii]MCX8964051.1 nickel/cobalt efflux protein RcnA [Erwinia psidii]RQM39534.1 nickel/cobalt efflux protein RcnA [Erwinia psidii]
MTEFTILLQQGNAWFFIPGAILLGALHGLEPGHSKTMMAAFIIAIKGSAQQAAMLGLAATVSHTAIVWIIAFAGMYISNRFTADSAEPWLQLISAAIILATALWMFCTTLKGERDWRKAQRETAHHHHDEKPIDTGHGRVALSLGERGRAYHWRLRTLSGSPWQASDVSLVTDRGNGPFSQVFHFVDRGDYLESELPVPEPHPVKVRLSLGHRGHVHHYELVFGEHDGAEQNGLNSNAEEYQDAHQLAHARDIQRRFNGREVTDAQILLFGLTGGLIPCPAAITVLLICIQLKALVLGATMVICFSIGLALTLVTVGVAAALSVRQAARWPGFAIISKKAPLLSSLLMAAVGVYMAIHGWNGLMR